MNSVHRNVARHRIIGLVLCRWLYVHDVKKSVICEFSIVIRVKTFRPLIFKIGNLIPFDFADGASIFDRCDKYTNNNTEQPLTKMDSKCQRKSSDESDLCPPSEGFSPIFEPCDDTIEHKLLVADAATGE